VNLLGLANLIRRARNAFGIFPSGFPDEWAQLPTLAVDARGWLQGDGVQHVPMHTSWGYSSLSTPSGTPQAIVAHVSATNHGTAISMAKRRVVPRKAGDRPASWHVSIEGDGAVVQMASCLAGTWHAGGKIDGLGDGNRCSIGIELIGWERGPFPDAQVIGAARVWSAIVGRYGIPRDRAMIEHATIAPGRRTDPGKHWMRRHAEAVLEYAYAG
jgi:N-acetyl-anhydromuramyl-L-alanine amidase AmpD